MKSVIIGTAGHIDHGKTALVKALTGIDADRLEEEKRRGITIDIGFAHLELPTPSGETLRLGFVDVPGHERFIRNMLAGVGGIDLVLFVIAADESIKPQTREHFDICRLLGVRHGITVLTKSDLVTSETLEVVRLEVSEFLRGSFLDPVRVPMIAVSASTGTGLDQLKQALTNVASEISPRDSAALARLPVDRVFTMKGFGTVVTGTLISGTVHKDQELEVFPKGGRVRIRGIQVHDAAVDQSVAGQRTALNLASTVKEDLSRGMMLGQRETFRATQRVDALLGLLSSAKPLKNGTPARFHAYTTEMIAEVRLHGVKELKPGDEQFVNLRLTEPSLLVPGDHFILRQLSPLITIGGGVVLDVAPLTRKQSPADLTAFLSTMAAGTPAQVLSARVKRRGVNGLSLDEATGEMNIQPEKIRSMVKTAGLVQFGEVLIDSSSFTLATGMIRQAVEKFHKTNPLVSGISKEELRERTRIREEIFSNILEKMSTDKKLEINGDLVRLPGRGVVMKGDEAESKQTIENAFSSAGLRVPALKEVLAELKVDKTRAQKLVTLLLRDKTLVKIADDLVFHREALENLKGTIAKYKTKSPKINVAQFKDLTGVSRKYAIPLLEFLDRERITRRVGDERVIL
jgi:selenocysteine-specific elongation factor